MRRAIHPQRQAGDDGPARLGQGLGKTPRIGRPLRGRVAAADHGDGVFGLQIGDSGRAVHIEQQRRILDLQQRGRVVGVAQGQHAVLLSLVQPLPRAQQQRIEFG